MLQEEVIAEESQDTSIYQTDIERIGRNPFATFEAKFEELVQKQVQESQKSPKPKTREQVIEEMKADSEKLLEEDEDLADDEADYVPPPPPPKPSVHYVAQAELDAEVTRLQDLSDKAKAGDTKALDTLRHELDKCPHIWRRLGDLQVLVEQTMAAEVAPENLLLLESYRKRASEMRQHLTNSSQDLLVQLAVSRVVSCWLFAQFLELRVLQDKHTKDGAKQLAQAECRFQSAVRTLTLAKKLEKHLASA